MINRFLPYLMSAALAGTFVADLRAQTLFSDSFETDTSAQWSAFGGGNGVTNDFYALFNFNYSTQTFRYNGAILNVPPAPNSTGTGRGLKVAANRNRPANPRIAAVSLYPKNVSFSNNFALRFDMFMDYNGDVAGGGSGSTEYATFGVDHVGDKVNWFSTSTTFTNADWPSDGVWFMVTGEGGRGNTAPSDYVAYVGNPAPGSAIPLAGGNGGFLYEENVDYDNPNAPMALVLPAPPGQSHGAPGKQWVQVEISQIDGVVTWKMNGYVIASHTAGAQQGYNSGTIMLGYNDPLSGIPSPAQENYVIYDNVRVVDLGTSGPPPTVRLAPIDTEAAEPSDAASFVLEVVDQNGSPIAAPTSIPVNLSIRGTASNGVDFVSIPNTIILPAGTTSTNILITPINDGLGEPTETILLRLLGSTNYDVRGSFTGSFNLADDGDVTSANVEASRPIAYENERAGQFSVFLSGPAPSPITVNYVFSGTASNGVDFATTPTSAIIQPGETNVIVAINPIDNSVISANTTVTLTIRNGTGYAIGTSSNATVTIRNDDLQPASAVLFSDNFDSNSAGLWAVNKSRESDLVTFAYDYSADGIPPAPNAEGTTRGVKLEANVIANAASGISLSPLNGNFTGDYRLRFDAWINYPGPLAGGSSDSTEWIAAGVGTTGNHPILPSLGDGIWFDANGDGSSTIAADFEAFRGSTSLLVGGATDVWVGNSQAAASPYYAEFGNLTAPQAQIDNSGNTGADQSGVTYRGSLGFAWHDWVITKQGSNVTWTVDGLPFASVPIGSTAMSSNVFVGYYDPSANINASPAVAFVIFDNVRVESLNVTITTPSISGVSMNDGTVTIRFSGATSDAPASFKLLSASTVDGTFVETTATITSVGEGVFEATTAVNGPTRFYRVSR